MVSTAARAGVTPEPPRVDQEQRLVVQGVTWREYLILNDAIESPGLRMSFCDGALEIMTTSRKHEELKKFIARLVETWALENDVPLYAYGSTTFREEARSRGAEPDECWVVGQAMTEFPEIVLEVVLSHGGIDKLALYRGMDVREVWFWLEGRFHVYVIDGPGYRLVERSGVLPDLDFQELATLIELGDQPRAIRTLRDRQRQRQR